MVKVRAMRDVTVNIRTRSGVLAEYAKHDETETLRRNTCYVMVKKKQHFSISVKGTVPGALDVSHLEVILVIDKSIDVSQLHDISDMGLNIELNFDGVDSDATKRKLFKFRELSIGNNRTDHEQSSAHIDTRPDPDVDTPELGCIQIKIYEFRDAREFINSNDEHDDSQASVEANLTTSLPTTSANHDAPSHYVGVSGTKGISRGDYKYWKGNQGALLAHYKLYYRDEATLRKMGVNVDHSEDKEDAEDDDIEDENMIGDPMDIDGAAAAESKALSHASCGQLFSMAHRPKQK